MVLEELVSDDEGLIVAFLDGFFYLLIISLTDVHKIHGLYLSIYLLINLKAIFLFQRVAPGYFSIERYLASDPRMAQYLMNAYAFVGVNLQHPSYEIGCEWVEMDVVGDGVIAL